MAASPSTPYSYCVNQQDRDNRVAEVHHDSEDQLQIDGELLNEVIEESVPVVEIAVATELDAVHVGTDNEQR